VVIALCNQQNIVLQILLHNIPGFITMIGRAAYHTPDQILLGADAEIFGGAGRKTTRQVVDEMRPYIERHLGDGGRLNQITRHMLGLFHGRPGARGWRRALSEGAHVDGAGLEVLDAALACVQDQTQTTASAQLCLK
jgi:tRNA-dihydrouridine synthase A